MKKILSCLLTSVLFLSLIPGSLAQSAPLMAPQGEAQGYLAKKEGIQGVFDPTAWSANPAVQGGEERLSGYERLKREWPECVRCVEASPFPHSGW